MDDETDMLAPIDGALPKIKPLTPVQRRRLESAAAIADDPPEGITFQHTVLCQTCMPYRDPGESTRVWERRQGAVFLALEAGRIYDRAKQHLVEVGLPFGAKPRLILAHLNREALRQGSPRIEVENSLTAFIRRVTNYDSVNAREIGVFRHQLSRFAVAQVRMAVDQRDDRAYQVDTKIIDFMELWNGKNERQHVLWPAVVELSPRYYASLIKHAVPLDERALGALANSPMALDVYAWLAQRLHRIDARRPQFITWAAIYEQFGVGYARIRDFRGHFRGTMNQVLSQYPAARVEDDERGITLRRSPPPVRERLAITPRPTATIEQARETTTEESLNTHVELLRRKLWEWQTQKLKLPPETIHALQEELVRGLEPIHEQFTIAAEFLSTDSGWQEKDMRLKEEMRLQVCELREQAAETLALLRRAIKARAPH